jgi:hypothetical protein
LPGLALNHEPPDLCLLRSWDYRLEPPTLGLYSYLKQTKNVFFKNEEQKGRTGPVWGWYQWEGEDIRKGCRR